MTLPVSHAQESLKLTGDAYVDLYQIQLKNTSTYVRFTAREDITWQGNLYSSIGCSMSGDQLTAEGQEAKPSLTILNPAGIFNTFLQAGTLDLATVTRRRFLRNHVEANLTIYQQRMWYVSRIRDLISGQSFTIELRSMSEGPNFWIPARAYLPPEFPTVSF